MGSLPDIVIQVWIAQSSSLQAIKMNEITECARDNKKIEETSLIEN